jgi:hypothetical protein
MSKTACKEDKKTNARRSEDAEYACKTCGAEAKKEKHLCKPKKI